MWQLINTHCIWLCQRIKSGRHSVVIWASNRVERSLQPNYMCFPLIGYRSFALLSLHALKDICAAYFAHDLLVCGRFIVLIRIIITLMISCCQIPSPPSHYLSRTLKKVPFPFNVTNLWLNRKSHVKTLTSDGYLFTPVASPLFDTILISVFFYWEQ